MNLSLGFAFLTAILQLSLSTFAAEATQVSSAIHDAQTLLKIADEFLYCFLDQSSKQFPPTGQTYTDAVSRVIRSFAPKNNDPLLKAEAIVFQTNLATSIADNIEDDSQQKDHPQILPMVLQLISDCFTEIAGYQPSKLIRSLTSLALLEDTDLEKNSLGKGIQEVPSKAHNSANLVNKTRLKTSMENYKSVSTNEIDKLVYDRRPRQTSQSFTTGKSPLLASSSSVSASSLKKKVNKRNEFRPSLNRSKQVLTEDNDLFKLMEESDTDRETSQLGLKVNQEKPPLIILPTFSNNNHSNFSVTSAFSIAFSDAVKSSEEALKAFETSLHPVLAGKAYYSAIYNAVFGIRSLNPVTIARIFSMAVKATFNKLTTSQHLMTHGNVVGKYLKSRGLFTPENVMTLSSAYVNFIASAVASAKISDSRNGNIQAIIDGLMNFLIYLRVFPTGHLLDLATDFSDSVFSFTGIRRRIFPSSSPACEGLIFNQIVDYDSHFQSNLDKSSLNTVTTSHDTRDDKRDEIFHNSFISGNSKNCQISSVISLFTQTFSETISFSDILTNAFERRLSGTFLSEILFSTLYDYFTKLGIADSSSHYISHIVSQLVNTSYYAMTPVVITNTISNVIGHKLFDENILSMKNFEQLSDSYIYFLEISLRSFDSNHTTRSIITSILEGSENFLSVEKISLAENLGTLAEYFAMALNSSIESQFSFDYTEFSLWPSRDEVPMISDFDSFGQISNVYPSELRNTAVFTDYILDEILFYPHLSKLFYLPSITADFVNGNFLNSLLSDRVDSPVENLIRHEIAKTSGSLDSFSFAELFIKSLERFLTARHVLKPKNAIVMARALVRAMNEAVKQHQDSGYNLSILINTTAIFLEKYLIFGVDHAESWSSMFLSELSSHPNFVLSLLINKIAPEILSSDGLLSTESSTRINNIGLSLRKYILSFEEVDIKSFTYHLIVGASQISNDYPALKPEKAFIQALLEGVAALIGTINGAYITALDVWGYQNEVSEMCEAFSVFLDL